MGINKIALMLNNWMNEISPKSKEESDVIQYGIELLLDNIVKFVFIQIIGIVIGKGLETLLILSAFCGLRLQAGGIHARTGTGCGLSMVLIWAISLTGHTYLPIGLSLLPYIYIISLIVIWGFAPRTINIEYFTPKDILKKKLYSVTVLTIIMTVAYLNPSLRELLIYPVVLEVLTLFPKNKTNKKEIEDDEKGSSKRIAESIS